MSKRSRKAAVRFTAALAAIIGLGSIGVALWMIITEMAQTIYRLTVVGVPLTPSGIQLASTGLPLSTMQIAMLVLLGSGVIFCPIAPMYHFGLVNKSKGFLIGGVFFAFLGFGGQLATGILSYMSSVPMPQQLSSYLLYTLNTTFDGLANSTNTISIGWYDVMQTFQCCGYYGLNDFLMNATTMAAFWKSTNPFYYKNDVTKNTANVPPCCCVFDSGDGRTMEQMLDANCARLPNPSIAYYQGCGQFIIAQVTMYQTIVMIIGFVSAAFTIVLIAVPIYYIRHLPKKPKPKHPPRKTGKYTNTSYGRGAK